MPNVNILLHVTNIASPSPPTNKSIVEQQQPQATTRTHAHHTADLSALVPGMVLLAALPDLANGLKAAVTGTYLTNAADGSWPTAGAVPAVDAAASQKPPPVSSERTASRVAGRGMVEGSS